MLRELFDNRVGQSLEVVESVTTVESLSNVLSSDRNYQTISIVNMYGGLIGLIPKSFVVVLLEHHMWYEHTHTTKGVPVEKAYKTMRDKQREIRKESLALNAISDMRGTSLSMNMFSGKIATES